MDEERVKIMLKLKERSSAPGFTTAEARWERWGPVNFYIHFQRRQKWKPLQHHGLVKVRNTQRRVFHDNGVK